MGKDCYFRLRMGPKSAHREGQKNALDLYNVEIDITLIVFSVGGGGETGPMRHLQNKTRAMRHLLLKYYIRQQCCNNLHFVSDVPVYLIHWLLKNKVKPV